MIASATPRTYPLGFTAAAALPVMVAVVLVRATPVLGADFPLNDGGLFFAMAADLRHAGLQLPAFTSYNGSIIPFAYPPLGIYIAAVAQSVLPVDPFDVFRWDPLLFSIAAVAAMFLLAREFLPTAFHALVATAAFGLLPQGYIWGIEGGGVTRAPGQFLALLAVVAAARAYRTAGSRQIVAAGILGGLTAMTHLNAALFTAVTFALLTLRSPTRQSFHVAVRIAVVMAIVSSPYLVTTISRVGLSGFVGAGSLSSPVSDVIRGLVWLMTFNFSSEAYFPFIGGAALLGIIYSLSRRVVFITIWLLAILTLDPRLGLMYATVPLAILAAVGFIDVVLRLVPGVAADVPAGPLIPPEIWAVRSARWLMMVGLLIPLSAALVFNASVSTPDRAVLPAVRDAAKWAADNTPPEARFVVISGDSAGLQGEQEWFPVLAGRVGVATPQGTEWLGRGVWAATLTADIGLQACAPATADCLESWSKASQLSFDYVFLPKGRLRGSSSPDDCCAVLRASLEQAGSFTRVYGGPGADIFRWTGAPSAWRLLGTRAGT
jgi:hypothetical protein